MPEAHEILETAHLLVDGGPVVELVQEQHVHPIGAEPFEARLHRPDDVAARRTAGVDVVALGVVALRRDHQLVAVPLHQPAEDAFGLAAAVRIGGIEEVDAGVTARRVHPGRSLLVGVAAERHGAEAELRDLHPGSSERSDTSS